MFTFLRAGLTAAGLQLAAVITVTALALPLRGSLVDATTTGGGVDAGRFSTMRPLVFIYLVIAAGLAMTHSRLIDLAAKRIRQASRKMSPIRPGRASQILLAQSGLATILFAVVALRMPPDMLVDAARHFGCDCAAALTWAGIMSIGVACFGATAHAAFKAL